ncbi:hypothetical protein NDU88_001454, partial [Pleurodeles waltl]
TPLAVQVAPMLTIHNVVWVVQKTDQKRKTPASNDGPPLKKGPSQWNTAESSQKSSGGVTRLPKRAAPPLKDNTMTLQNTNAPAASMINAGPQDKLSNCSTDCCHRPGTPLTYTTPSVIKA